MSNELINPQYNFPTTVANIKENKVNNFDIKNSSVIFNVQFPQSNISDNAEQLIAVQSFSKEYYQLIVTCDEDFITNNVVSIPASRALNQYSVPPEIFNRCSTLTENGINKLKTFPAIICHENTSLKGITDSRQFAIYAYIKKVRICGKEIKVAFQPIAPIQQQLLCIPRNAVFFDLNMDCAVTDLNYSAWSVHKTNLFEAFREAGIRNVPMPNEVVK